jgi:hypothetical protein
MKTDNTNYEYNERLDAQAKQIVSLLDAKAQHLSMRALKQLENGRNQAVSQHQKRQGSTVNLDGTLSHWVSWAGHHRIAVMSLALVLIMTAFVVMQNFSTNETSDAFLLGADLPPEAFVDKGFEPSLNQTANL